MIGPLQAVNLLLVRGFNNAKSSAAIFSPKPAFAARRKALCKIQTGHRRHYHRAACGPIGRRRRGLLFDPLAFVDLPKLKAQKRPLPIRAKAFSSGDASYQLAGFLCLDEVDFAFSLCIASCLASGKRSMAFSS